MTFPRRHQQRHELGSSPAYMTQASKVQIDINLRIGRMKSVSANGVREKAL